MFETLKSKLDQYNEQRVAKGLQPVDRYEAAMNNPLFAFGLNMLSAPSNGLAGLAGSIKAGADQFAKNKTDYEAQAKEAEINKAMTNIQNMVGSGKIDPTILAANQMTIAKNNKDYNAGSTIAQNAYTTQTQGEKVETGYRRMADGTVKFIDDKAPLDQRLGEEKAFGNLKVEQTNAINTRSAELQKERDTLQQQFDLGKLDVQGQQRLKELDVQITKQAQADAARDDRTMANNSAQDTRALASQLTGEWKAVEPNFLALEQSFATDPKTGKNQYQLAEYIASELTQYPNIMNTAAEEVASVFGSDANDKLNQYKSTMTSLAMAMHNGGVMTDADFNNYMTAQGSPNVGLGPLKAIIENNAQKAGVTYDRYLGLKDQKDNAQNALLKQPATSSVGVTSETSDSGGKASGRAIGQGW